MIDNKDMAFEIFTVLSAVTEFLSVSVFYEHPKTSMQKGDFWPMGQGFATEMAKFW